MPEEFYLIPTSISFFPSLHSHMALPQNVRPRRTVVIPPSSQLLGLQKLHPPFHGFTLRYVVKNWREARSICAQHAGIHLLHPIFKPPPPPPILGTHPISTCHKKICGKEKTSHKETFQGQENWMLILEQMQT